MTTSTIVMIILILCAWGSYRAGVLVIALLFMALAAWAVMYKLFWALAGVG